MKSLKLNIILYSVLFLLTDFESSAFAAESILSGPLNIEQSHAGDKRIIDLINRAGNADNDETRLELLLELTSLCLLDWLR